jgi:hypothetical protein
MPEQSAFERQVSRVLDGMGGTEPIFDPMAVARAATARPLRWKLQSLSRMAAMVTGAAVVAILGGFLLTMGLMQSSGQDQAPAAESSASLMPAETAAPSSTTKAFAVPFSYVVPEGMSASTFYEDDQTVAFADGAGLRGTYIGQGSSGTSDARGVVVEDMADATVDPCPSASGGQAHVPLASDPATLLDDLRDVGGMHLEDQADATLGGLPAITVRSTGSDCSNAAVHLRHALTWVDLGVPSWIIVADVRGTTVMAQIWATTDAGLEPWLPMARGFLDSIEFLDAQGHVLAPRPIPADQGTFTPSDPLPPGTWESLFALRDGRAVAIGQTHGIPGATAELWDPVTGMFTEAGSVPESHESGASAMLSDGRVLIAGGLHGSYSEGATDTAALWDPSTNDFGPTGSLVSALLSPLAVTLSGDRVLVVGGTDEGDLQALPELWDPASSSFTDLLIEGAYCGIDWRFLERQSSRITSATLLPDGRALMLGEVMADLGSQRPCAEIWDVDAGTATELDLGLAGSSPDAATVLTDGRVVVFSTTRDGMGATLWDPATGTAMPAGMLPGMTSGPGTVLLTDGRVLVVGGFDQSGDPVASAELWDPGSLSFEPTGDLDEARGEVPVALLQDGRVLIAGGRYSSDAILGGPSSTEVFALR